MMKEHTVKRLENWKGHSCAPSVSIFPCHLSGTEKGVECSFLLVFICFTHINTP